MSSMEMSTQIPIFFNINQPKMRKSYATMLAAGVLLAGGASLATALPAAVPAAITTADEAPKIPNSGEIMVTFGIEGEKGSVKGVFTAPTMFMSDWETGTDETPITGKIQKVVITRECYDQDIHDVPVAEYTDVEPGAVIEFTDEPTIGADWNYRSVVTVDGVDSESWGGQMSLYAGVRPNAVEKNTLTGVSTNGQAPVTLSFVMPDGYVNLDGNFNGLEYKPESVYVTRAFRTVGSWESLDRHEIWRQENPVPGETYTLVDDNNGQDMPEGTYDYRVVVTWQWGESQGTDMSVGLYLDTPAGPQNVVAEATAGGALITWDAVEAGASNGYVDPSTIVYDVYRYENYTRGWLVAENVEGTSAIDNLEGIEKPTQMSYQVVARNEAGSSSEWDGISNIVTVGPASPLPFEETFSTQGSWQLTPDNLWTGVIYEGNSIWEAGSEAYYTDEAGNSQIVKPSESGHGLAYAGFNGWSPTGKTGYISGDIDFRGHDKGVVKFRYYTHPQGIVKMRLDVMRYDDGQPGEGGGVMPTSADDAFETVWEGSNFGETAGWVAVEVPFEGFGDADKINIRFMAENAEASASNTYVPAAIEYVRVEAAEDVSVEGIEAAGEVVETRWFNMQGVRISAPAKGEVSIRRSVMANGAVRTEKVIVK